MPRCHLWFWLCGVQLQRRLHSRTDSLLGGGKTRCEQVSLSDTQNGYRKDASAALQMSLDEKLIIASLSLVITRGGGTTQLLANQRHSRHAAAERSYVDARWP